MAVLLMRNAYLQLIKHDFFEEKSQKQLKRLLTLAPNRGHIYDRNLVPLTVNQVSYSVYATPHQITDKAQFAKDVTIVTGGSWAALEKRLHTKASFVWVKRKLSEKATAKLKAKKLTGIGFIKESKRVYPKGSLASQIVGFVGIDNQGLSGIEYQKDEVLKGTPGKIVLEGDPRGNRLISGKKITYPPFDGKNIVTTIDETIQFSAERHLAREVEKNEALRGTVIVMNPKTGEILAMASYPTFDPNKKLSKLDGRRKVRAVTDVYEPGSTFKVITAMAALEESLYDEASILEIPETIRLAGHTISEAHRRPDDEDAYYTFSEVIEKSLNVGVTQIAQKLGEDRFYRYIRQFGFGQRTGISLPGEAKGLLRAPAQWSGLDIAMFSFGQGLAVTPIQLITAMTVLANDGVLIHPRIISYESAHKGKAVQGNPKSFGAKVISKKTADSMRRILARTVSQGTGRITHLPGYEVFGKTGTAQRAREDGRGYEPGKYIASFFGGFPASDPAYFVLAIIDSPSKDRYYGSSVAGPVFRNVVQDIIYLKNIPPSQKL